MNVIETTGLGRRFGWTWALRNCSLAVPAGRVTALVGPNGAGKSTLLHLAVGLASPTEGNVRVLGGMAAGSPEALEQVAFVAQNVPLYRHLSVRDMVHLARNLNRRWDQARADRRLAALDIPLNRKVGRLSGGQQAQVALTIALARRPEFLVLDEPLAPLDPLARHEFLASVMEAVAEDGISVLFSSHALTELERVADYLVVLAGGRVQVSGDAGDLLATHRMLTGPAHEAGQLAPAFEVVHGQSAQAQAHVLARFRPPTPAPDGWQARPVTLEELVLAYLREPSASALPGPGSLGAGTFTGAIP
jgi:ABC-2 type transport system ATP-binding protein